MAVAVKVVEAPYEITQVDPAVKLFDGVAGIETVIVDFTVPDETWFVFQPADTFGIYLADTAGVEAEPGAIIRLIRADPNEVQRALQLIATYERVKEMVDRTKIKMLGKGFRLEPKQKLLITVRSARAMASTRTRFTLTCVRLTKPIVL